MTDKKSMVEIVETFHPLESKIFPLLDKTLDFHEIIKHTGLLDVEVMRALQWLSNKGILEIKTNTKQEISLDENGSNYVKDGLPEKRMLIALKNSKTGEMSLEDIQKNGKLTKEEAGVSLGLLKSKLAIEIMQGMKIRITDIGKSLVEKTSEEEDFVKKLSHKAIEFEKLSQKDKQIVEILRKRKNIVKITTINQKEIILTKLGKDLLKEDIKITPMIEKVTPQVIRTNSWEGKNFRKYDVALNVPRIERGKRHFVRNAIDYTKRIMIELGFAEMHGDYVHTSFWDLDCLFVPQDHPARAMQDTFYLKDPSKGDLPKFADKIKEVHENGADTKSKGWQTPWSFEKAKELMLRTHTTVLSAHYMKNLKESDLPVKLFSVGKVFRNETLDWKHLFEFHQVEGIVIDKNANFSNLIGYLEDFFGKMGYKKIRIRPAHFPYTEPSAEIDVYIESKKQWVELGGCGIFRPEVVKPLLGIDIPVLAWGFGLERIITPYYGITDLRDLYKNDIEQLKKVKEWMK